MAVLNIRPPLDEISVRGLRAGDEIAVSGRIFTARDRFHRDVARGRRFPADLRGGILFHCGPLIVGPPGHRRLLAAGPTTSIREEPYMAAVIAALGVRMIIGKGGMGADTLAACARHGCVYAQAPGGAAQFLGACVKAVAGALCLDEYGPAEALWELVVENLPVVVSMDTRGRSLHASVAAASRRRLRELLAPPVSAPERPGAGKDGKPGARQPRRLRHADE